MSQTAKIHHIEEAKENDYTVALVPPDHTSQVWKDVRGMLEPAVDQSGGRWTMEHLLAALITGQHHLWIVFDDEKTIHGAMTTQMVTYPNSIMLAFQFVGGKDFESWGLDMFEIVRKWGKDNKCDGMEGIGRFGFWKWLKKDEYAFKKAYCVYERSCD
tara:strand:+ start:2262 stop:2735 length:474 start_codon:yes stop_codon:yes gene_type:complete